MKGGQEHRGSQGSVVFTGVWRLRAGGLWGWCTVTTLVLRASRLPCYSCHFSHVFHDPVPLLASVSQDTYSKAQQSGSWPTSSSVHSHACCLPPAAPLSSQSAQDHCQTECQVVVWIGLERVGVCCVGPCPEISRSAATTILRGGAAGQNPAAIMAKPSRGLGDPSLPQPEHPEKGSVTGQPALLPCPAQSVL